MQKGERYVCECCGGMLQVMEPCTCEQKQDVICSCGEPLRQKEQASR